MARRFSSSQLRNKIRQAEARRRKAISDYNQAVRNHNRRVKRVVDDYNREVRAHNTRVRANRRRLQNELTRLTTGGYSSSFRSSSRVLYRSFTRVETRFGTGAATDREINFLDLSERETANSLAAANALAEGTTEDGDPETRGLDETEIGDELLLISPDLDRRWRGALYSLDPRNPDAARHFCTSAREIFVRFLEHHAPDDEVVGVFPSCDRTQDGRPTRRSRIKLLLARQGLKGPEPEEFATRDIDNILELFGVFNRGTHGSAGRLSLAQLKVVKRRVEDGILFLASLVI